jgi:MYXO-CTERM domain-containing protein
MKKALLAIAAVVASVSALAQDGSIIMKNVGVLTSTGASYNVPLYQDPNTPGITGNVGAGLLPGGVTVGLFTATGTTPLATGLLGTSANLSPYIATPQSQTVTIPGAAINSTVPLVIRAWTTSAGSFAAASTTPGAQIGEWQFTSAPLGGTPAGGGLPTPTPTFTGWGTADNAGFHLTLVTPEPTTVAFGVLGLGALVLARRRK